MSQFTYSVTVHDVEKRRGVQGKITSYRVSWRAARHLRRRTFRALAQAEAYRSELQSAARRGEPFLVENGLPASWAQPPTVTTWFDFSSAYAQMKWPHASPNHRRGIAEALTDASEALTAGAGGPTLAEQRAALRWTYSTRIRDDAEVPADLQESVAWLSRHSITMDTFADRARGAPLMRAIMSRLSMTQTGERAATNTMNRKRMVLHNAMEYAIEIGMLTENPLRYGRWTRPPVRTAVDPRVVINPDQAHRFLAAVEAHSNRGRRLKAFFACMYYAALRPEEASELRRSDLTLPKDRGQWGELLLTASRPRAGSRWTNSGEIRESSPLKHRAEGDSRRVPVHPELAEILAAHLDEFGPSSADAPIFVGHYGGPVTDRTYLKVFHESRRAAFTAAEAASPLMEVPYSLRHAAVSTWLRTTGDAALVARWAGHSVHVLLKTYAKAVHGSEHETLQRIWDATRREGKIPDFGNE